MSGVKDRPNVTQLSTYKMKITPISSAMWIVASDKKMDYANDNLSEKNARVSALKNDLCPHFLRLNIKTKYTIITIFVYVNASKIGSLHFRRRHLDAFWKKQNKKHKHYKTIFQQID